MVMPRCLPAMQRIQTLIVGAAIVHLPIVSPAQSSVDARDRTAQIVVRIQHADYAGDREVLLRLHEELSKLKLPTQDVHLFSRVRYWQGFAFWRRAFNGFNDGTDRTMLERARQALTLVPHWHYVRDILLPQIIRARRR